MDDKLCLLVVIGADDTGRKEVLVVVDGYRESEASWLEVLSQLTSQGISVASELAMGDGALGFWNAVSKHWPTTRQNAYKAFGQFETPYAAKYPKAVACLTKDKVEMLDFMISPPSTGHI